MKQFLLGVGSTLAVLVVAVVVLVTSLLADDGGDPTAAPSATPTTGAATATGGAEPTSPATGSPDATEPAGAVSELVIWYVGEPEDTAASPALFPEVTDVTVGEGQSEVQAAVDHLLTQQPVDPDYSNLLLGSPGSPATAVVASDATGTTVDVGAEAFAVGVGSQYAVLGVQQLVETVLANGGTAPVRILVDGVADAEVWGAVALEDGYDTDEQLWTLSSITSLRDGETLASPVPVSGMGMGYEGELLVRVTDTATGQVVSEEYVQLAGGLDLDEEGRPGRGTYEATVELPPGTYLVVVADWSGSDEGPAYGGYDDKVITVE